MATTLFSLPGETQPPHQAIDEATNSPPLVQVGCLSRSMDPNSLQKDGIDYYFAKGEEGDVTTYVEAIGGTVIDLSDEVPEVILDLFQRVTP